MPGAPLTALDDASKSMTPRGGTRTGAPSVGARRCCGSAAPGWRSRCRRHRPARTAARRAVRRRSGVAIFPGYCSGDPRYYATSTHSLQHTCRRGGLSRLERAKGFEPSTPTLARLCSTPELHPLTGNGKRRGLSPLLTPLPFQRLDPKGLALNWQANFAAQS